MHLIKKHFLQSLSPANKELTERAYFSLILVLNLPVLDEEEKKINSTTGGTKHETIFDCVINYVCFGGCGV